MTYPCFKCGFKHELREECPRCVGIKAKYPELIEYIDACVQKAKDDAAEAAWEASMGDDL